MTSLPFSPRESPSTSFEIINIQRPFSILEFVLQRFEGELSISATLQYAINIGAQTLIIENISTATCIEYENKIIALDNQKLIKKN